MAILSLVNGQRGDSVSIDDRGLAYGDGLFETIAVYKQLAPFLSFHLERLRAGCTRLGIHCDFERLMQEVEHILLSLECASLESAVLKLIISRESSGRGYATCSVADSRRILLLSSAADYSVQQTSGVKLRVCDHRLPVNPALAGIKHLNRLDNVLARTEWRQPDIAEGLMLDTIGYVVEGTMSNVFVVIGGVLKTPSLKRCGVAGVMRSIVMQQFVPALGIEACEQDLRLSDLLAAEEMFICNSLMGIVPVVAIGCHHKPIGGLSQQLLKHFHAVLSNA